MYEQINLPEMHRSFTMLIEWGSAGRDFDASRTEKSSFVNFFLKKIANFSLVEFDLL